LRAKRGNLVTWNQSFGDCFVTVFLAMTDWSGFPKPKTSFMPGRKGEKQYLQQVFLSMCRQAGYFCHSRMSGIHFLRALRPGASF
jgi:hypothetical protein